jgi:predicted transcriptional regulator
MEYKLTAKEVMSSPVVSADSSKSVFETAKLMKTQKIGTVVVTMKNRPVGIATEKDIVIRLVAEGKDPNKVKIGDIMTAPIMVASSDSDMNDIAKKMAEKRVRRVPIVENGKIVGIITERDILKSEPALIDAMKEVVQIRGESGALTETGPMVGICEECDEYNETLMLKEGRYLCPECRGE